MTTATKTECRIYVASLADYNAGRLHGRWIDADQPAEDILADVLYMLAESKEPYAEEWAIHDYDLGGCEIDEWTSFEAVAAIGEVLSKDYIDKDAFAAWYNYEDREGDASDLEGQFNDVFMGEFDSDADMASDLLDSTGELEAIPENLRHYFDYEAYARDMMTGDVWKEGRYYFCNW